MLQYNHLKANPGKCNLLSSSKTPTDVSIGHASLKTSTKKTLLGILIDSELSFLPFVVTLARNYKRALRLAYSNHVSSFNELLKKDDHFLFPTETFKF